MKHILYNIDLPLGDFGYLVAGSRIYSIRIHFPVPWHALFVTIYNLNE